MNELRELGFEGFHKHTSIGIKSPQDPLSGFFSPDDIVVANIERIEADAVANLVMNSTSYLHFMGKLVEGMELVALVCRQGWITKYLEEQEDLTAGEADAKARALLAQAEQIQLAPKGPRSGFGMLRRKKSPRS